MPCASWKTITLCHLTCHSFDWLWLKRGGAHFVLGVSSNWYYSTDILKLTKTERAVVHFHNMWQQLDSWHVKGFTRGFTTRLLKINVSGLDQHSDCLGSSLSAQVRLQFEKEFDQFVEWNKELDRPHNLGNGQWNYEVRIVACLRSTSTTREVWNANSM